MATNAIKEHLDYVERLQELLPASFSVVLISPDHFETRSVQLGVEYQGQRIRQLDYSRRYNEDAFLEHREKIMLEFAIKAIADAYLIRFQALASKLEPPHRKVLPADGYVPMLTRWRTFCGLDG